MQPADAKFSSEAQSWRRRAAGAGGVAAARTRSARGRLWGGGTGPRGDRRLDRGAARSAPGSVLSAGPRDRVLKQPRARSGFPASARTGHPGLLFYSLQEASPPPPPFLLPLGRLSTRRHRPLKSVLDRAQLGGPGGGGGGGDLRAGSAPRARPSGGGRRRGGGRRGERL